MTRPAKSSASLDIGHQAFREYTETEQKPRIGMAETKTEHLVTSGAYYIQLDAGDYTALRRMVVVK